MIVEILALVSDSSGISKLVLRRVAAVKGTETLDLAPLYDFVDPTTLEEIVDATESGDLRTGKISFPYCGRGDGPFRR